MDWKNLMNANQLKLIMMSLMVLDHLAPLLPPQLVVPFNLITRCVGVFFGFMAVEGFHYTRSRKNYLLRLYGWAGFMFLGNTLINTLIVKNPALGIHNNIFLTLAIGVSIIWAIDFSRRIKEPFFRILALLVSLILTIVALLGLVEGGFVVVPFMLISYFFREQPRKRTIGYIIFSLILLSMNLIGLPDYSIDTLKMVMIMNPDFLFITVLPFIALYNGEKGSNKPIFKYTFYVFYPAHLWLITLIAFYLNQA